MGLIGPLGQIVAIQLGIGFSIVLARQEVSPLDLALPNTLAKLSILFPGSGHDTDKAPTTAADAGQILGGGQLTVGHIDEVGTLEQLTQAQHRAAEALYKNAGAAAGSPGSAGSQDSEGAGSAKAQGNRDHANHGQAQDRVT